MNEGGPRGRMQRGVSDSSEREGGVGRTVAGCSCVVTMGLPLWRGGVPGREPFGALFRPFVPSHQHIAISSSQMPERESVCVGGWGMCVCVCWGARLKERKGGKDGQEGGGRGQACAGTRPVSMGRPSHATLHAYNFCLPTSGLQPLARVTTRGASSRGCVPGQRHQPGQFRPAVQPSR